MAKFPSRNMTPFSAPEAQRCCYCTGTSIHPAKIICPFKIPSYCSRTDRKQHRGEWVERTVPLKLWKFSLFSLFPYCWSISFLPKQIKQRTNRFICTRHALRWTKTHPLVIWQRVELQKSSHTITLMHSSVAYSLSSSLSCLLMCKHS